MAYVLTRSYETSFMRLAVEMHNSQYKFGGPETRPGRVYLLRGTSECNPKRKQSLCLVPPALRNVVKRTFVTVCLTLNGLSLTSQSFQGEHSISIVLVCGAW